MNEPGRIGLPRIGLTVRALVVCAMIAACASAPPTPITSMSQIEGRWQGTITLGFNGPQELYWLTIQPDGRFEAQWGMNWQWGTVTLSNGAGTFEATAPGSATGTLTYYVGPGKRTLTMNSTFGNWSVQVTPRD